MFDSTTFTQDMLSNPAKLAKAVIDAMESTDTSTPVVINDPNNGFVMQLLANVSIFAQFSQKVDSVNSYFYPQRARNADQLYPHLSQFDYVELMASPATLPFYFAMDKNWIISHSVYFDANYNKIEIPATSYLTVGGIIYSMYYPIEILVNRNTGAVTAFYDTTIENELNVLASNMLLDVREYTMNGLDYFGIRFNMYQFQRSITSYTVSPDQGFIRTLSYTDQFYAVKVFSVSADLTESELAYSLSTMYYDFTTPTVLISLLTDTSQVRLQIPQIYFDNGQIPKTLRVELYTTKGQVNYTLSMADVQGVMANFDTKSSAFAAPLDKMPTYLIVPTTLDVSGGSNVKSYAQIRDAVVNQRLYDRVAVTTPEIIAAGQKAGFALTRVTDDLTERMYFATNILTDSNAAVIPTFAGNIYIAGDSLAGNPSTVLNFSDGYYTILPTTTFTIAANGTTCSPMTNGQVATMAQMTNEQLVAELNKGTYVRQPFHITLLTNAKSPQALIYNLLTPTPTSLAFVAENAHSAPQMSATSCKVTHLASGTGGYQILLGITRSSNIQGVSAADFNVYLTCMTKTDAFAYLPAQYVATDQNGVDTWEVQLSTSYHITTDDYLTVSMFDHTDISRDVEITLNQSFNIVTSFNQSYAPTVPADSVLNQLLPPSQQTIQTVMSQQTIILGLGQNLSKQIYCGVNTSWGNDVYQVAEETVYYITNEPIFQITETGVINTRVNATTHGLDVVPLYLAGATPSAIQDITLSTTAIVAIPAVGATTTTYPVADSTGLLVGMYGRGTGIPVGARITQVQGNNATLSGVIANQIPLGTDIIFTNPSVLLRTSAVQGAAGVQLTVPSTANLLQGQSVFGFDIPTGAKIATIDSLTQFSITVPTTVAVATNTLLTFINTSAHGVVKTQVGDIITDPTGAPVIVKDAQNQYLIPAILFDGRLFASQDLADQTIVKTISGLLQSYADQISTIDAGLIEDSEVYYKPSRTMGFSTFGIGGGKTVTMSLELGFTVTVYVDVSVLATSALLTTMTNAINAIINQAIQQPIISMGELGSTITTQLGNNVSAVEMGNISGKVGLRLISLEDPGATPSVENILSIQPDGTITRTPNIVITFLPKPDTTEATVITA